MRGYRAAVLPRVMRRSRSVRVVGLCCGALLSAAVLAQASAPWSSVLQGIAAENAVLVARVADAEKDVARANAELAGLQHAESELKASMQRVEQRAAIYSYGTEFAQLLVERRRELAVPERLVGAPGQRERLVEETSNANLRTEHRLAELGDLDAAAARHLAAAQPPVPAADRPQAATAVRTALDEQRALLQRLAALQVERMKALGEADKAARTLAEQVTDARGELTRLLFRIPIPSSARTLGEIPSSLAWTFAPANWGAAAAVLWRSIAQAPLWPVAAIVAAAALFGLRSRLRDALVPLSPAVRGYERYRIADTLAALAISVALALPGPLLLWTAGTLLRSATDTPPFPMALGDALVGISRLVLALSAFAWLLDRRGVAVSHFGWDEGMLAYVARALRRFSMVLVPLMLIAALNGLDHAPFTNRESLGRGAFSLSMLALAAFLVHLVRRRSPLVQAMTARRRQGWLVKFHPVWRAAFVALPIGILALAATGYFVVAGHFFTRLLQSMFLVLAALVLYGLIALWVQVQRSRLSHKRDEESARPAPAGRSGQAGSAAVPPHRVDIAAIGEQTRSLLDLLITVLLLAGMWFVWNDAVPLFSLVGDYTLWSYTETVDGKEVTRPLTVGHLLIAALIAAVTAVAVRNVGALLDIVLLQRLELQSDATYAIKVMVRYAICAVGVVAASRVLGIGWSDVQWLVAALSVGVGFGLQEIIANFVSGLIVLAERPIRIGDVITVGDITGTVSRVRARATSVIDFDNKEVIIPNKSFITERVVNWTLSDQTTRLLLKVSVPYGVDVAVVQRALLGAVRTNPDVQQEPPPSVYFVGFGDSALNFEIRVFVGALDLRLRVQQEIYLAVERVLRELGVDAPAVQTDLRIRSTSGVAD